MTATERVQEWIFAPEQIREVDDLNRDCETRRDTEAMLEDFVNGAMAQGVTPFDRRTTIHVNYYEIAKTVRS